jgi:hypothetical protein
MPVVSGSMIFSRAFSLRANTREGEPHDACLTEFCNDVLCADFEFDPDQKAPFISG